MRSEGLLRRRLQELSHDLSDASLQQVCVCVVRAGMVVGKGGCAERGDVCGCMRGWVGEWVSGCCMCGCMHAGLAQPGSLLTAAHAVFPADWRTDCCCCCPVCQMPEFHQRVSVLQQLGYVSPDGTVTLKGRAACEINSTQVCGCVWGGGLRGFLFIGGLQPTAQV